MKQPSLFDDDESGRRLPSALGVPGSAPQLSRQQKQFNRLIAQIQAEKELLLQWQDYLPVHQRRCADEIAPLNRHIREARIQLAGLFDASMRHPELTKRQRDKLRQLLLELVSNLLEEERDEALERLHDRHSRQSFEQLQNQSMEQARGMAEAIFGVDLSEAGAAATPEELLDRLTDKLSAQEPRPQRKRSAKAREREAQREQTQQDATRAMREVYRRLASELHPDREKDPAARQRKTELMQQVNQAYKARDLLRLLELQLQIEQLDTADLAGMAEEKLARYNDVLKEQLQRLRQQRDEIVMPFAMMLEHLPSTPLRPEHVGRAMDADIRELRASLQQLRADLAAFVDVRRLKAFLNDYQPGPDELDELLDAMMPVPRRHRRATRRRG